MATSMIYTPNKPNNTIQTNSHFRTILLFNPL